MKTLKLTEGECIFIHYILRRYAKTTEELNQDDREEIYEIAAKFY